ncbi:DUF2188 domain-containing protein [Clavibacter tessellarius]|uniref:DUF2188 domain-containing protein n=1 Tax=Clavibacter TaxID=1573 RepID=UPI001C2F5190|nr:DUF2188 domain-containing protein [Clavibacter michiganensis]
MSGREAGVADEGVQEFIDSIDPSTMRDAAHLRRIAAARTAVEAAEEGLVDAVRAARRAGDSWTAIGMALRTSKQNAHRKYAPLVEEGESGPTASASDPGVDVEGEVVPSGAGGWDIVIVGSPSASAHFGTQAEAAAHAREIIWGAGGGEISIHGRDGSVRARTRVPRRVS